MLRKGSRPTHIAVILLMVVLLSVLALAVSRASGDQAEDSANASEEVVPVRELPGRSTATSDTYLLSDGSLETRLFQVPVNYRDEEGEWQPIDQELRALPDGTITNGANSFDLHLPDDLDQAPLEVSVGDEWVSQIPVGIGVGSADVSQGVASYDAAGGSTEIEFSGLSNGLKENIVLADPSAPSTLHFRLDASPGVVPSLAEDGSIRFENPHGELVAQMPAPVMLDGAGTIAPASAVGYDLEADSEGSWRLTVLADRAWLAEPDRAWPVTIDPTVAISAPALDCGIANQGFSENSFCGTSGWPYLGVKAAYKSSGADEYARTLLRFNLAAIPAKASIASATIAVYATSAASNVSQLQLYDANKPWGKTVSWKNYGTAYEGNLKFPWTTEGGDFGKYVGSPGVINTSLRGAQAGWWGFSGQNVSWLVQRWVTGDVPNEGVLIKLGEENLRECCITRRIEMASSATATKPFLSVQYDLPASADSVVTSPSDGTKTAKRFVLASAWDHSNVEGVKFQYRINGNPPPKTQGEIQKPTNPWADIPPGQVIDRNNQTVSWPLGVDIDDRKTEPLYWNPTALAGTNANTKFQIRAVLSGSPGASGYTKPVEAELNRTLGGPKDAVVPVGPGSVDLLTGNFSLSRNDVSLPAFNSSLTFSRSISSAESNSNPTGVLGPGWQPSSSVEVSDASGWQRLKLESREEEVEEEVITYKWASLKASDGTEFNFPEDETGKFETPAELAGTVLYRNPATENIEFTDPSGARTVFSNNGSGNEYLPKTITQTGGEGNKTQMIYQVLPENKRRLKEVIAPSAPGITCTEGAAGATNGCRLLEFRYQSPSELGLPASAGDRLSEIRFKAAGFGFFVTVAKYSYDAAGRLSAEWDPRISPNLKETYGYGTNNLLTSLTPPGLEPWSFEYGSLPGETSGTRLAAVKRASLVPSKPMAQTTIVYGVPLSGSGLPDLTPQEVARWGQEDLPTDATAIFPPNEVPAYPPSSYARAAIYYMDAEGQVSNVSTPAGAGTADFRISTTETDTYGNIGRELTPGNRLRALSSGSGSAAKSRELDTQFTYSADGTKLLDERGPVHPVRVETGPEAGAIVQARTYSSIQYDVGAPEPKEGEAWPLLPTHETTGALVNGKVLDQQTVQHEYNWTLRQQIEEIVDPEGLKIRDISVYDKDTGLPIEVRQPKDATNPGAGSTKITYYRAGSSPGACEQSIYAGLPCKIEPVAQPPGAPNLRITRFASYTSLGKPTEVIEEVGSPAATRKTLYSYDAAGRQTSKEIVSGSGTAIPKVETLYDASKGFATINRFVCPGSEPGCDTQATTTTYDALGRVIAYQDADGNTAAASYDPEGRVSTFNDGKGTQTFQYDAATGFLVGVVDSAAGTFTASYDADGAMVSRGLPNGLTAASTVNAAGEVMRLTYTKASNCGASCTWIDSEVTRSASGRILSESGTLGTKNYSYDASGRLTKAAETPSGGGCTTRAYAYDANSNRTLRTTRSPGVGGVCTESGGTSQAYSYDSADRLLGEGLVYDAFGRITSLPASLAGGKALSTSYFSNDMVASQSQTGITNTYQLDAKLRHRQRLQAGGLEGTEVFHYASPGDSPAWTERGTTWTRNIIGIGGELAAMQESGKEITLTLTNLHGDVVASAAINPAATGLKGTFAYDEFGNPTSGSAGRFGWLGGIQRRTELPSGVIQMGARSYVPAIGRFLSTDPISGGSANAYDYGNADPVNQVDPSGLKPYDSACDPGAVGCQVKLEIWMWSPRGRRMGVRMRWRTNRALGITLMAFRIDYWLDDPMDVYKEGFVEMPPPHYLNSYPGLPASCKGYQACAENHDGRGTFACTPGFQYQIQLTLKYIYNQGRGAKDPQILEVKAQQGCKYPY